MDQQINTVIVLSCHYGRIYQKREFPKMGKSYKKTKGTPDAKIDGVDPREQS